MAEILVVTGLITSYCCQGRSANFFLLRNKSHSCQIGMRTSIPSLGTNTSVFVQRDNSFFEYEISLTYVRLKRAGSGGGGAAATTFADRRNDTGDREIRIKRAGGIRSVFIQTVAFRSRGLATGIDTV